MLKPTKETKEQVKELLDMLNDPKTDEEKRKASAGNILLHRMDTVLEIFMQAFGEKMLDAELKGITNFLLEKEGVEYAYFPVPLPEGTLDLFNKLVAEECDMCDGREVCEKFEKNIHASVMKALLLEHIRMSALLKIQELNGLLGNILKKGDNR